MKLLKYDIQMLTLIDGIILTFIQTAFVQHTVFCQKHTRK